MKVGAQFAAYAWRGGPAAMGKTLAEMACTADEAGFDLIGVADHLWQAPHVGGPVAPELECFTSLGVIAANTRRVRMVPIVAGVHVRPPAVLAKAITTLDVLSGGRGMLGIGAGWYEAEARGMGVPFPPLAERFAMLEETLQICLRLWHGAQGDERPYTGQHYHLERPLNVPQSLTRPHPPILIGGGGEQKTLRLVARYGDACNLYPTPDLAHKLEVLRQRCAEEGRDYDTIEKTCMERFDVANDEIQVRDLIDRLRRLADLGIETVIGIIPGEDPVSVLKVVGEKVIPEVARW
jgi:F420-dependent oxidoreductase-like protein